MWQSPVTVTPPAAEPISLEQAKQYLRIDEADAGFDIEFAFHVAGARDRVETITNTRLIDQTVDLRGDSFADLARLPIGPITSVVSVTYRNQEGEQTLGPDDVELAGAGLDQSIAPVSGTWPASSGPVMVRAIVGYGADGSAMPPSVKIAMLQQVRALFEGSNADIETWLVNHRIWL